MYSISLKNIENTFDYEELIKVFLRRDEFVIFDCGDLVFNEDNEDDKNAIKREIYLKLKEITGYVPPWGILTGVRPVKLAHEYYNICNDYDLTKKHFLEYYLLSNEKADLLIDTLKMQKDNLEDSNSKSVSIYIGIPFCPTRCAYCSFTSNQKPDSEIRRYLEALKKEITFVSSGIKEKGLIIESIYIGGGTPTTLNDEELNDLLSFIFKSFPLKDLKEFTVEAGRPDTITKSKLEIIKSYGIERISINPQTMNDKTLKLIGRNHSSDEIISAFKLAREVGINIVNCDLIMGLPGENIDDFNFTLDEIFKLNPENITVHTLAVKRTSKIYEEDIYYSYRERDVAKSMVDISNFRLKEMGYNPYYLYRQKNMSGSFENVGWCRDKSISIYNIRIMDEHEHILALGAGGMSKIYFKEENRHERIPNVSNYEVYIDRIDEMIDRKRKQFFDELK